MESSLSTFSFVACNPIQEIIDKSNFMELSFLSVLPSLPFFLFFFQFYLREQELGEG